jgi:hypothetical protein
MHRKFPIGSITTNKEILEFISSVTKPWSTIKKISSNKRNDFHLDYKEKLRICTP